METPPSRAKEEVIVQMHKERSSWSDSARDKIRAAEPWSDSIEALLKETQADLGTRAKRHDEAGYYYKTMDTRYGYVGTIFAAIMGYVSVLLDPCDDDITVKVINVCSYSAIAFFTGTAQYFKYSTKSQQHFDISSRFSDIITDIKTELAKRPRFRTPADTFLERVQIRVDNLTSCAPVVPKHIMQALE